MNLLKGYLDDALVNASYWIGQKTMMVLTITKKGRPLVVFKDVERFDLTDPGKEKNNGTLKIIRLWKGNKDADPMFTIPVKKGMDYQISHECGCELPRPKGRGFLAENG